ncbi:peptidoglycan-binding lysin domain-containing protein [Thermincola ferriacetica]|uniref:Peptidoglycan-binding lysin domain-containing protein n=1 Tax=Thermincola ferriacetica TaxID=281456 RepID=A0A0L6W7T8_9FIRM|nr:LysM peptidoglycan-binding domain-containing protein [Thermincola ferriacetica]KNZ71164.1 peptidoglycan-binding lysin domain-containing protein [Thermincola ferriacetica]
MFISYRKMAQGMATFVLAAGITVFAFTSGDKAVKQVDPPRKNVALKEDVGQKIGDNSDRQKLIAVKSGHPTVNGPTSRGREAKPAEDFKYQVQSGDTLYDLAIKYGVSIDEIMLANKITSDKLSIGQELIIPVSGKYKNLAALKRASVENSYSKKQVSYKTPPSRSSINNIRAAEMKVSSIRTGELIPWSEVNNLFPRGAKATVIDVDTGLTFKVRRLQGTYHADSEPLTAEDTAVLKRLYGGRWSWTRRAVVVLVNGKYIAGSINGMPHAEDSIPDNNFPGHICIHFKDSKTHGSSYTKSGRPTVDQDHQAMVRKAAGE